VQDSLPQLLCSKLKQPFYVCLLLHILFDSLYLFVMLFYINFTAFLEVLSFNGSSLIYYFSMIVLADTAELLN